MLQPAFNQLFNGHYMEIMLLGKLQKFCGAHHRTVFPHDLTAETTFLQPCQTHKIYGSLCMSGSLQHAALSGLQWEHMARSSEILRHRGIIYTLHGCQGTLYCRDTGRCVHMVNGYGKSGRMVIRIHSYHLIQSQFLCIFSAHRHTDQTFGQRCHSIYIFCCCKLSGTDQISFIFPVRIINDQDQFALSQIFQCLI